MKFSTVLSLVAVAFAVMFSVARAEDLARGWGDSIDWRTLEAAKAEAATSGKPIMLVVHKTWCGACKALKPKFAASDEIAELAQHFVMVNVQDDEEPEEEEFKPDGGYIPRIVYLDSAGKVVNDLYNKAGNPKYKYYYTDGASVAAGMRDAKAHFASADL
eukprot:UC1_evm1s2192